MPSLPQNTLKTRHLLYLTTYGRLSYNQCMLNLNYTYRIYPDAEQVELLNEWLETCRGVYIAEVDHKGTSQTCPNCRIEVPKELSDRWHSCPECKYEVDRDIASAQEICNRGYEQLSTQGLWGKEIGCQVGLSGALVLDKWRRAAMSNSDVGSPHHNL